MGWIINETVNTVKLTDECIDDLWKHKNKFLVNWKNKRDIFKYKSNNKYLKFNDDHMEYICSNVIEILKKHKVNGEICFESVILNDSGTKWGYQFDGIGGFNKIKTIRK